MAVNLTIAGQVYVYPTLGDEDWGTDASDWAVAVSTNLLQRTGGLFTLTNDVNFGATFGTVQQYLKSRTANIATAEFIRLAVTDSIAWRNNANSANLLLSVNASDQLQFNGAVFLTTSGSLTASRALQTDGTAAIQSSSVTTTELGYVSGVTSAIQTQLNAKQATLTLPLAADLGGTGVANNAAATLTRSGSHALTLTTSGVTGVTLPTTGTLATLAGTETLTNKSISASENTLTGIDSFGYLTNVSISASIASNILTVSLVDKAGSTPSSTSKAFIGFRNATVTTGTYTVRAVAASTTLTIGIAASLGLPTATSNTLYIFALDNAGTVELFASAHPYWNEAALQSTSTTGTSNQVLYGANARSSMPIRLIGKVTATWTTAVGYSALASIVTGPVGLPAIVGRAYRATVDTFPSSASVQQTALTVSEDTVNSFASSTYTVAAPGRYLVMGSGIFAFGAEGYNILGQIQKNSTVVANSNVSSTAWGGGAFSAGFQVSHMGVFAAGDTIKFYQAQQNAAAANRSLSGESAGTSTYLLIQRLGY